MLHPHIADLHAFHVAANQESFTRAAQQLKLTQPALSQKIRRLEKLVGARLFVRKYRGVTLTDAGQQLHEASRGALDQLDLNFRRVLEGQDRKRVRISTDFAFASHWLMSRLPQLRHDLDGLDLQVLTSQQPDQQEGVAIDLSISLLERHQPSSNSKILFNERVVAVCSPDLAARYGPFDNPHELLKAPLLNLSSPPNAAWHSWRSWFSALGINDISQDYTQTSLSNYTLILQGAVEGQGIALGWLGLVDSFLDTGLLCMARDEIVTSERAYVMECARDAPLHVRDVFEWIGGQCAVSPTQR
ncbi:LysR family transcriptional regulator [Pelagibius sp. Alg239-R121]|uniref:LysR family transcriptional regulator n=1 Tax=Pelagibius sp. Alg239-R121 TaxID=2993448 RepID=UPI0024A62B93|nr:LysR family transcriptional regulator [Pelagibius sp. Alg239-R121]